MLHMSLLSLNGNGEGEDLKMSQYVFKYSTINRLLLDFGKSPWPCDCGLKEKKHPIFGLTHVSLLLLSYIDSAQICSDQAT